MGEFSHAVLINRAIPYMDNMTDRSTEAHKQIIPFFVVVGHIERIKTLLWFARKNVWLRGTRMVRE